MGIFYIEPGEIKIDIDGTNYKESLAVTGSKSNIEIATLNAIKAQYLKDFNLKSKSQQSTDNPLTLKDYNNGLREKYYGFIADNLDSYVSLEMLGADLWKIDSQENIARLYQKLSKRVKASDSGVALLALLNNSSKLKPGEMAPEFTEKGVDGMPVSLKDYRGRYVLLDFWASWCRPCRAENPYLVSAYNKFKDDKFTILSVSLAKSRTAWLKAIKDDKMLWPQVSNLDSESSESAIKYGIKSIPDNFLIDPNGKIIAKDLRGEILQKILDNLFDSKQSSSQKQ